MESLQHFLLNCFSQHSGLNSALLYAAILAPLIMGGLLIITDKLPASTEKLLASIGFAIPALIAIWLWSLYNASLGAPGIFNDGGWQFITTFDTGLSRLGISLKLGLNGISAPIYLLAGLVGAAAGFYAFNAKVENPRVYHGLLLIMLAGLMGAFSSIDIFFFYFFHELALIPTFIMLGLYGGRQSRSIALELTIYLTLGAMLSLTGLIVLYVKSGVNSFDLIALTTQLADKPLPENIQNYAFGMLLLGFGTLVSLWPLHSWAPRGYAAAPASTAMLHAGVLKKFGLLGLIQIAAPLIPMGAAHWAPLLMWLALGNVLIIGFVTMAQDDLKQMLGYSSVMHMGYIFLAFATLSTTGIGGAVTLMVAHGLSAALLFMLADMIERRTKNLDLGELGGLVRQAPTLAAFFVVATLASAGLPGFANFWGELTIFTALFGHSKLLAAGAIVGIVISAVYGLRAVSKIFFGEPTEPMSQFLKTNTITDLSAAEKRPAILLIFALLVIGFFPKLITESINAGARRLYADKPVMTATAQPTSPVASTQASH
ncbi:MAG: NADH-quinone oxidoreductase subunit M [Verrucomicrobiota bacterium]|nr:NADH-quinone oxidoreductase subunit M [Verrucomicrobiota bacterium]